MECNEDEDDDDNIHKYHIESQLRSDELNDIRYDINENLFAVKEVFKFKTGHKMILKESD